MLTLASTDNISSISVVFPRHGLTTEFIGDVQRTGSESVNNSSRNDATQQLCHKKYSTPRLFQWIALSAFFHNHTLLGASNQQAQMLSWPSSYKFSNPTRPRTNTYSGVKETSSDAVENPCIDCQTDTKTCRCKEEKDEKFTRGRGIPTQSALAGHNTSEGKEEKHDGSAELPNLVKSVTHP